MRGVSLTYLLTQLQADAHEAAEQRIEYEKKSSNRIEQTEYSENKNSPGNFRSNVLNVLNKAELTPSVFTRSMTPERLQEAAQHMEQCRQRVHSVATQSQNAAGADPDSEAVAEAQEAVADAEAKHNQLLGHMLAENKQFYDRVLEENKQGNHDPNFYQIKATPTISLCSVD